MEFLNKIELRGIVENVSLNKVGGLEIARFSLCVEQSYADNDCAVVETTWFACSAWGDKCPKITELKRGCSVHVIGRVRTARYVNVDGEERRIFEVLVQTLELI